MPNRVHLAAPFVQAGIAAQPVVLALLLTFFFSWHRFIRRNVVAFAVGIPLGSGILCLEWLTIGVLAFAASLLGWTIGLTILAVKGSW